MILLGFHFSSLNSLLFLSNHNFQQVNVGIHSQAILRRHLFVRLNGDNLAQL